MNSFISLLLIFLWHFHFHLVKAFAINTDDGTLADKGSRVNHFDETEDVDTLILFREQTDYLALLPSVPSVAVEDSHTVFHLSAYLIGYLLPFLRENQELYRLPLTVHDIVEHEILNKHRAETEHNHLCTLEVCAELRDEETAADDDEIDENKNSAE